MKIRGDQNPAVGADGVSESRSGREGATHEWSKGEPNFLPPVQQPQKAWARLEYHIHSWTKTLTNEGLAVGGNRTVGFKMGSLERYIKLRFLEGIHGKNLGLMVEFWVKRHLLKFVAKSAS